MLFGIFAFAKLTILQKNTITAFTNITILVFETKYPIYYRENAFGGKYMGIMLYQVSTTCVFLFETDFPNIIARMCLSKKVQRSI
jgi:hypothetical protein